MARTKKTTTTTKATTNSKSVKETKTMAKATTSTKKATTKTTTKATVNKVNVKETKDMVKETKTMTMELSAEEIKAIEEMRAGKKPATKVATKAKGAKAEENNFDKDLYYSIAETLGVLGKNGVFKVARPVVYKLMELDKIKKSDITKAQAEIVEIAKAKNLGWLLEKLGVEVEDEAEDVDVTDEEVAL